MKSTFILAASAALAMAVSAQADTLVITGATSFRGVVHSAISAAYPSAKVAYDGSAIDKATVAIFDDRANSGHVILTSFTGSVDGIRDLDQNRQIDVINVASVTNNNNPGIGNALKLASGSYTTQKSTADAALSDVFQASTDYQSKNLQDNIVGVMPFVWATNNVGKSLNITNITSQQAFATLFNGGAKASSFTANADHDAAGYFVYATGRDSGSGTRMTALAEIKYPHGFTVNQYQPTLSGTTAVTGLNLWPGNATTGLAEGDGGYSSGGDVATALNASATGDAATSVLISYIAYSDTIGKLANGQVLSYNGVPYTPENVKIGTYTFWGYEHLFLPEAGLNAAKQNIVNLVTSKIPANLGQKGIDQSAMSVMRVADGDIVF